MARKKSLTHMTRRQTLAMLGCGGVAATLFDPVEALLGGLVDGFVKSAQASGGQATSARNHVFVSLAGAPPRWYFDLPLDPYETSPKSSPHPFLRNRFSGDGETAGAPVYQSVPVTRNGVTVQLPWLWSCDIPTSEGGNVPMAELASNMLIVRGVNMGADGHAMNRHKQLRPLSSAPSLSGLVADASTAPVPAVGLASPRESYRSAKGVGQVVTNADGSNPLKAILSPFDSTEDRTDDYMSRRRALDAALERAMRALGEYSRSSNPGAESLSGQRDRAERLLRAGIGDVAAEYAALARKYQALFAACATSPIPGVTDRPVRYGDGAVSLGHEYATRVDNEVIARNPDLRSLLQATTRVPQLAEGFAVAEYLLTHGYSSAIVIGGSNVSNVQLLDRWNPTTKKGMPDTTTGSLPFDEHFRGHVVSVIINSFLYRGLSACLYELIRVLRARNLFDETVIQIGSEFNRLPRNDMRGSDHGWAGNCTSIFSGCIDRPMVLGNLIQDASKHPQQKVPGTWGASAAVKIDGSERDLGIGNVTSTVARLLRVTPPMPNSAPVVAESSTGVFTPAIELATIKGS